MNRRIILVLFMLCVQYACSTPQSTSDTGDSSDPMPPSYSEPSEGPPLLANRPGGGSGATPATGPVAFASDICMATFNINFEGRNTVGDRPFVASKDDSYRVKAFTETSDGVELVLIYLKEIDSATGEDDKQNEPVQESDGVIGFEIGDKTPKVSFEATLKGAGLDALPVSVDCDFSTARQGTAFVSDVTLYRDAALMNAVCQFVEIDYLVGRVMVERVGASDEGGSAVFSVSGDPLMDVCEGASEAFFEVKTYTVDGVAVMTLPIQPVLLKPEPADEPEP